jgi:hypothetical protein
MMHLCICCIVQAIVRHAYASFSYSAEESSRALLGILTHDSIVNVNFYYQIQAAFIGR